MGVFNVQRCNGPPPVVSNACFVAGTPIVTDQGIIAIDKLVPSKHTIRGMPIKDILQTKLNMDYLVQFQPHALYTNVPSQVTVMSPNHCVFFKGRMIPARCFSNVPHINYNGETLYNVLLETHDKMIVNNMIVETLNPKKYSDIMSHSVSHRK